MYFKITILLGVPPPKTFRRALLAKVSFALSNIPKLFKTILNYYLCQGGFFFYIKIKLIMGASDEREKRRFQSLILRASAGGLFHVNRKKKENRKTSATRVLNDKKIERRKCNLKFPTILNNKRATQSLADKFFEIVDHFK